ncbi:copper homeostasis protein CutC [Flavobacteriaceae bacterium TP-CH-4]|uniref:PF03932 family protein CutC n=1 Tax=Pelagihabitans pacificus TaxID=2696054 RepID=A0A967AQB6_9FLAO|nr:copper homeostasis protein CutC [Pelagihabitans pacificus]NHF58394.1 copper homeostasis protein CutC [Pelagihabitans pacificus]
MLVEVCANSLESALNAEKGGADRIELCSELGVGGITPSYGLLTLVREQVSIPVHVLIRPRGGDFSYSKMEFEIMKKDIAICVDLGFEGIVCGVLLDDFSLDEKRTEALVTAAENLSFTFHRAFDWVNDPYVTLRRLEAMGVANILSSGQQKSALEGIDLLHDLHREATTSTILPGSGISLDNVGLFRERGFKAIHLSGTRVRQNIQGTPKIPMSAGRYVADGSVQLTDTELIQAVVSSVK